MVDYIIITMDNCSYCDKAKEELRQRNKTHKSINIMDLPELSALSVAVGRNTFPLVLKVVGGYSELLNQED